MAIVGLIPFVYATIKRKRRSMARAADSYAYLATGGTVARGHEHARRAYQSQSCHFTVRPSPDDEVGFPYDFHGPARLPPPKMDVLSRELLSAARCELQLATVGAPALGRESARFDGGGYQSQSCRFAVRPSPLNEPAVLREGGASRGPLKAQPECLSRHLLLPASRPDGLATGIAREQEHARSDGNKSQSCRFAVHHSAAYEHGVSHDGVASPPSEDLSGKLLLPAGRTERGLSRSLRFSSMRVFAW
jgi:hypothetical protein